MSAARVRATGLLAGIVVLLAGCGAGPDSGPRVLPSASVAVSASPSSSPTPTGINAPTAQGASEFVRFFYAEISRAFAEKDPTIVSRLSLPTCKTCKLYVDSITGIRDRNESVDGARFTVNFAVAPADPGKEARVDVGWSFSGAKFLDASGKVIDSSPPESGVEEQVEVNRVGSDWRVATIKRVRKR